jgi:hypothetical protein
MDLFGHPPGYILLTTSSTSPQFTKLFYTGHLLFPRHLSKQFTTFQRIFLSPSSTTRTIKSRVCRRNNFLQYNKNSLKPFNGINSSLPLLYTMHFSINYFKNRGRPLLQPLFK